jgi:hypothetical protein
MSLHQKLYQIEKFDAIQKGLEVDCGLKCY